MRYFGKEIINDAFDGFRRVEEKERSKPGASIFCMGKWTRVICDISDISMHGQKGAVLNGEQEEFVRMFSGKEPEDYSYRVTLTHEQFEELKKTLFAPNVQVIEFVSPDTGIGQ